MCDEGEAWSTMRFNEDDAKRLIVDIHVGMSEIGYKDHTIEKITGVCWEDTTRWYLFDI